MFALALLLPLIVQSAYGGDRPSPLHIPPQTSIDDYRKLLNGPTTLSHVLDLKSPNALTCQIALTRLRLMTTVIDAYRLSPDDRREPEDIVPLRFDAQNGSKRVFFSLHESGPGFAHYFGIQSDGKDLTALYLEYLGIGVFNRSAKNEAWRRYARKAAADAVADLKDWTGVKEVEVVWGDDIYEGVKIVLHPKDYLSLRYLRAIFGSRFSPAMVNGLSYRGITIDVPFLDHLESDPEYIKYRDRETTAGINEVGREFGMRPVDPSDDSPDESE